jgi:hypothetical protein
MKESSPTIQEAFKLIESHFDLKEIKKTLYKKMGGGRRPSVRVVLTDNSSHTLYYSRDGVTSWVKEGKTK